MTLRPAAFLAGAVRLLPLAALAVAAAACAQGASDSTPTADVVASIPFHAGEETHYLLQDTGGKDRGTGVLQAQADGDALQLVLRFENGGNSDVSTVTVDPSTLKPRSVHREVRSGDSVQTVDGDYRDDVVQLAQRSDGSERSNPLRLKDNSYDNDSSLFLWRTLALADGYQAAYHTVITNRRSIETVTLRVLGRETVDVPAGTFENAWKLEIRSGGVTQTAWIADRPDHLLVKYDNHAPSGRLIFLLSQAP